MSGAKARPSSFAGAGVFLLCLGFACGANDGAGDQGIPSPTAIATLPAPTATLEAEPDVVVCTDELTDFVEVLQDLDSRLGVGLTFQEYSEKVADAQVAYDRIDARDEEAACIQEVGIPAEDALNAYRDAYNIWNRCTQNLGCSQDSITPELQRKWRTAMHRITRAERALD